VRDATAFGPRCPQMKLGDVMRFRPEEREDEDCLVVNVWTPALDDARRPVMVWFHGGGFFGGSGAQATYDGARLAAEGDTVIVTVNFRLGALAFLYLAGIAGDEYAASGNLLLLDMVAALEWVRDNIAAFGGDPGNVTVFGQSAGGTQIWTLLGMQQARGLFHRAIAQSTPGHCWRSIAKASTVTSELLAELGLGDDPIEELLTLPVEQLIAAQQAVMDRRGGFMTHPFVPMIDGVVLSELPTAAIAGGTAAGVPLMVGWTRDEMRALLSQVVQTDGFDSTEALGPILGDCRDDILACYCERRPDDSEHERYFDVWTDRHLRIPALQLAEAQVAGGAGAPVYVYVFDWKSPLADGTLGAFHSLELPFVFRTLPTNPAADGAGNERLSRQMSGAWLAFARGGAPSQSDFPEWPRYELGRRPTMIFSTDSHVEDDPLGDVRDAWSGIVVDGQMQAPSLA
jgi:para-nitrobenzyl esterase